MGNFCWLALLNDFRTFDWAEEYKYPTVVLDQMKGLLAYSPVRGAFSERTIQFRFTTHAECAKSLPHFVLEIGASLVQ